MERPLRQRPRRLCRSLGVGLLRASAPGLDAPSPRRRRHPEARIHWLEDSLPDLGVVHQQERRFDLILLSAVWMFLAPSKRERAFRKLSELLEPGGLLVFTVKHGSFAPDRKTYDVDDADLERLARRRALLAVPLPGKNPPDALGRPDVRWTTVALRLPDVGTG